MAEWPRRFVLVVLPISARRRFVELPEKASPEAAAGCPRGVPEWRSLQCLHQVLTQVCPTSCNSAAKARGRRLRRPMGFVSLELLVVQPAHWSRQPLVPRNLR